MTTFILPGFSPHNEIWAKEAQKELGPEAQVVRWPHWDTGNKEPDWLNLEAQKIVTPLEEPVNILAKSIGTAVAMKVTAQKSDLVKKIILCGIPFTNFTPSDEAIYGPLKTFPVEKILVFQNRADPYGAYNVVEPLLHHLNPQLKIVETPRDDHEYPFFDEFKKFLT